MVWKATFFLLCDAIFLVRLQEKFEIDHSWEWKGLKKVRRIFEFVWKDENSWSANQSNPSHQPSLRWSKVHPRSWYFKFINSFITIFCAATPHVCFQRKPQPWRLPGSSAVFPVLISPVPLIITVPVPVLAPLLVSFPVSLPVLVLVAAFSVSIRPFFISVSTGFHPSFFSLLVIFSVNIHAGSRQLRRKFHSSLSWFVETWKLCGTSETQRWKWPPG